MKAILSKIDRIDNINNISEGESFNIQLKPLSSKNDIIDDSKMRVGKRYKIRVKKYMTAPATATFDFQDKWNNGIPMPLLVMTGEVLQETRGMYKMKLEAVAEHTDTCMNCGKTLTHPVSRLYGLGPECGRHFHINPYDSEDELNNKLDELNRLFSDIKWEGWVIKSAIAEWEEV